MINAGCGVETLADIIKGCETSLKSLRQELSLLQDHAQGEDELIPKLQNELKACDLALSALRESLERLASRGHEESMPALEPPTGRLAVDGSYEQYIRTVEGLWANLRRVREERDDAQRALSGLQGKLAESMAQGEHLKLERDLVLSSRSWTSTAPLRRVHSFIADRIVNCAVWLSRLLDDDYYRDRYPGMRFLRRLPSQPKSSQGATGSPGVTTPTTSAATLSCRTDSVVDETPDSGRASLPVHDAAHVEFGYEEQVVYPHWNGDIKLIAFYLPQFHPIPENDRWWGKGFTEWTNVVTAKPLFKGHHQPKLPGPLGFYDLRLSEVMREQIKLAQQHGIYGFCFHHYWFAGKRMLERPVEQFLADPSMNFPFCLCWANENWTRRWDGMDQEVLIAQNHSREDDLAFIRDAMRCFRDPRYIRVDGKPMLIVYRPALLPDAAETASCWRQACADEGLDLYLVTAQVFGTDDPHPFTFDAAVQFPPHNIDFHEVAKDMLETSYGARVVSYSEVARQYMAVGSGGGYRLFRCVAPGWDNTARWGGRALVFADSSPEYYGNWLREACCEADRVHPVETRFVFVNAWNEWAEGAYLEPDQKFGYAYLNKTGEVLLEHSAHRETRNILFVGHDAAQAGAQMVLLHLIRWLTKRTNWRAHLLLLEDGILRSQYEQLVPVRVAARSHDRAEFLRKLHDLCGRIDLVYGNTAVAPQVYDVLEELHVPIITHVHELEASLQRYASSETLALMQRHTTQYIAASGAVAENLICRHGVPAGRVAVVHAFIEPGEAGVLSAGEKRERRRQLVLPEDGHIVFGCGTPGWQKGTDLFIEVARRLHERKRNDVSFCWIGIGADGRVADPEALIRQYDLVGRVFMLGFRLNPRDYFRAGDAFLLTSREDSFPLACLEAAECGLPIGCFAGAGGMPEFVDEEMGFVVAHGDVEAMADRLMRLLEDDELKRNMGLAARRKLLSTHISDVEVPRICSIVDKAMASHGSPEMDPIVRTGDR